jgi:AcrR family transcriptional regulator
MAMTGQVKGRRQAQSAATRAEVLAAASRLFLVHGYAATTISAVADEAGVAVQTIYNSVGGKVRLLEAVVGLAAAGDAGRESVVERELAASVEVSDPTVFLERAAASVAARVARVGPVLTVVQAAASSGDAGAATLAARTSEQRMAGMRVMVGGLRARGGLRPGLSEEAAAAISWSLAAPETYRHLVGAQGWSQARYRRWLADAWAAALSGTYRG